ncbi:MAG TPA: helix-turn-helix transcriptional regulator [Anaerolineales bacterium]|nr:helix-turn-helix transcriptional regulator [Anaerolineales bacterium]
MANSRTSLDLLSTFGGLLKYLRRRARLTQRELSVAVKYSEAQISRLEQNQRPPDLSALAALFLPALCIEDKPETITRSMELATQAWVESLPESGFLTERVRRMKHDEAVEFALRLDFDGLQPPDSP